MILLRERSTLQERATARAALQTQRRMPLTKTARTLPIGGLSLSMGLLVACQAGGTATCGLAVPPVGSGEMASHGLEMRIFPRASRMPSHFTGCQTVWGYDPGSNVARKLTETRYSSGAVSEWTDFLPEGSSAPLVCRYANGRLTDTETRCPAFEIANSREQSLPAGCLAKLKSSTLGSDEPCFSELK